ncbi:MAG: flippase-like domain-containing protein [Candidatus Woesearchaeota archaeon]|nr:MAG: flippase-like domain-containing protein [Candidatus Woesearchaeota archaeon]
MDKKKVFLTLLGIFIILALFFFIDTEEVVGQLKNVNVTYFLIAMILTFISLFIKSYRWHRILKYNKVKLKVKDSFKIVSAANFLFLILPNFTVDFYRAYALKKLNNYKFVLGLSSALFEKILDFSVFIIFSIFWFVLYLIVGSVNIGFDILIVLLILLFLIIIALILMRKSDLLIRIFGYFEKKLFGRFKRTKWGSLVKENAGVFFKELEKLSRNKKLLSTGLLWTLIAWTIHGARFYMLALALNINIGFFYSLSTFFISSSISILSMIPGGLGSKEALIVFLLSMVGVSSNSGFSLALLDRTAFILISLFFAVMFYHLNLKLHFSKDTLKEN